VASEHERAAVMRDPERMLTRVRSREGDPFT
jgi:hypothetical protein